MHKQEIKRHKMGNGLDVVILKDARYTTSAVLFGFKIGWRNDPVGSEGLAHLFEHLVGKRTEKFKEKSTFDAYKERFGIKSSAMTYPDYTYYLQHQSHENLNKSIELMFESIYNSYFSKEDLDNEKKVVLSEASEYIDNDSTFLYSKNRENLFKNTSISRFFFGNKSTLKKISIPVFEDFYKYCRNPKNAFLIIAGTDSLNESLIIDDLNRLGSEHTNVTDIEIPTLKDKLIPLKKTYTSTRKRKQSLYLKSFRGSKMTIDKKIYFDFFKSLLSDGFNSKLISRLRDELGLIYWAYLNIIELKPFFEITIETSTEKKNLKVISSEMKSIIQQLYKISQNEIDNLKELVKFNILSTINAVDDATFALTSLVEYEELITTEEYLKKIANTKVEEVTSFIKDIESESMESILN